MNYNGHLLAHHNMGFLYTGSTVYMYLLVTQKSHRCHLTYLHVWEHASIQHFVNYVTLLHYLPYRCLLLGSVCFSSPAPPAHGQRSSLFGPMRGIELQPIPTIFSVLRSTMQAPTYRHTHNVIKPIWYSYWCFWVLTPQCYQEGYVHVVPIYI